MIPDTEEQSVDNLRYVISILIRALSVSQKLYPKTYQSRRLKYSMEASRVLEQAVDGMGTYPLEDEQ